MQTLEERLAVAYQRKAELKKICTLSPLSSQGITSLPFELLGAIFEITIGSNTLSLREIRLVCTLWNQVVLNTPRLWSYILVTGVQGCAEFCMKCIERSAEAPLDVSVEYKAFPTARKVLDDVVQAIPTLGASKDVRVWILDGVLGYVYTVFQPSICHLTSDRSGFITIFDHRQLHQLRPFSILVGENGQNMSRWRSFKLALGDGLLIGTTLLDTVFPEGVKIHPSLESLILRSLDHVSRRSSPWHLPLVVVNPPAQKLSNLAIDRLSFHQLDLSVFNPLNIRRLHLHYSHYYNSHSFLFILKCKNLEYLRVTQKSNDFSLESNEAQHTTFNRLITLHIGIQFPTSIFRLAKVPYLRRISTDRRDCFIPNISPLIHSLKISSPLSSDWIFDTGAILGNWRPTAFTHFDLFLATLLSSTP